MLRLFLELHLLELLSLSFLLVDKSVVDPVVKVGVIVRFILPIQITALLAKLENLGLLGFERLHHLLWPLEQLGMVLVEAALRRVEGSVDYGLL